MLSFLMMILGLGLVIWSLYSIRKEIENGYFQMTKGLSGVSDRNLEKIVVYLDELEKQMNDMNSAFYDLVSDLESSFSVHDKELSLLDERMQKVEKQLSMLTSEVRIENSYTQVSPSTKVKAYTKQNTKTKPMQVPTEQDPVMSNSDYSSSDLRSEVPTQTAGVLKMTPDESVALKQRILTLRKEGYSLSQIAKVLNIGIGELQLFIKLNTK